jgi:hypothetical protein
MAASSLPRYGGGHDTSVSRMSGLDDPAVRAWLARLETESAVLPVGRRAELRADVEELLAAASQDPDDDTAYERVLAELGPPEALVAEAGGYAVPPVDARAVAQGDVAESDAGGQPWLEAGVVALLLASVVLALVPATEAFAPLPWFVGTILVLLSRRWGPVDKGLAVFAFGVMGVPFVLLGRDELPRSASIVAGVVLVALWVGSAVVLLRRAHAPRDAGRGLRMS